MTFWGIFFLHRINGNNCSDMSPKGGSDWGFLSYLRGLCKFSNWNLKTVATVGTVSFLDNFSISPSKYSQVETVVTAEKVPSDLQDLRENRVPLGFLEYPVHQECRESQVHQDVKVRYDKLFQNKTFLIHAKFQSPVVRNFWIQL